jgi:hypothetical protein
MNQSFFFADTAIFSKIDYSILKSSFTSNNKSSKLMPEKDSPKIQN